MSVHGHWSLEIRMKPIFTGMLEVRAIIEMVKRAWLITEMAKSSLVTSLFPEWNGQSISPFRVLTIFSTQTSQLCSLYFQHIFLHHLFFYRFDWYKDLVHVEISKTIQPTLCPFTFPQNWYGIFLNILQTLKQLTY